MAYAPTLPLYSPAATGIVPGRDEPSLFAATSRLALIVNSLLRTGQIRQLNSAEFALSPLVGFGYLNFGSIAAGATAELTVTVLGAVVGDGVSVAPLAAPEAGLIWGGYISAPDTVKVRMANVTAAPIDPAAVDFRADVWRLG